MTPRTSGKSVRKFTHVSRGKPGKNAALGKIRRLAAPVAEIVAILPDVAILLRSDWMYQRAKSIRRKLLCQKLRWQKYEMDMASPWRSATNLERRGPDQGAGTIRVRLRRDEPGDAHRRDSVPGRGPGLADQLAGCHITHAAHSPGIRRLASPPSISLVTLRRIPPLRFSGQSVRGVKHLRRCRGGYGKC